MNTMSLKVHTGLSTLGEELWMGGVKLRKTYFPFHIFSVRLEYLTTCMYYLLFKINILILN
jgi:hypothetical protein